MKRRHHIPTVPGRSLLVLGLLLTAIPALAVPKTDVITLRNGDQVTCELKEMSYGKVLAKTSDMGTLSIKWDRIARVVSRYLFLITLDDGQLLYGQLPDSDADGVLLINFEFDTRVTRVPMDRVVNIEAIRYDIWDRINLSVSAGFNWTKASATSQGNIALKADYKGRIYRYGLSGDAVLTTERDNTTTRRQDLSLYGSRTVSGRLQAGVNGGLQRNDQLGLALRATTGLNLGYLLVMNRHLELATHAGLAVTREWADLSEPYSDAGEGVFSVKFTFFRYNSPKSNISFKYDLYPSLTVDGRVRQELNTSLRHEVVSDLFVELSYYESRDNRPADETASTSDRGIIFSLGWTK